MSCTQSQKARQTLCYHRTQTATSLLTFALLLGCVPIQSARVVQVHSFAQKSDFSNIPGNDRESQIERIYEQLHGGQWVVAKQRHTDLTRCLAEGTGTIQTFGSLTFVVQLMAQDRDKFFVTGSGQYVATVVKGGAAELLGQGVFSLASTGPSSISSLFLETENGGYAIVCVELRQWVVPPPGSQQMSTEGATLEYRIRIERAFHEAVPVFRVARTQHNVYFDDMLVAKVDLHRWMPAFQTNEFLIDLRGIGLLRDDYKNLTSRSESTGATLRTD